jgi:hypothetical protein
MLRAPYDPAHVERAAPGHPSLIIDVGGWTTSDGAGHWWSTTPPTTCESVPGGHAANPRFDADAGVSRK